MLLRDDDRNQKGYQSVEVALAFLAFLAFLASLVSLPLLQSRYLISRTVEPLKLTTEREERR